MNYTKQSIQRIVVAARALVFDRSGVTALEYGLIAALIALAIIGGVTALGTNLSGLFTKLSNSV